VETAVFIDGSARKNENFSIPPVQKGESDIQPKGARRGGEGNYNQRERERERDRLCGIIVVSFIAQGNATSRYSARLGGVFRTITRDDDARAGVMGL